MNDELWCYPPHPESEWRLCEGATNSWMGTIETKGGAEVVDLTTWAVEDFQSAFKFAQETVRTYNKQRFNTTLEDYS